MNKVFVLVVKDNKIEKEKYNSIEEAVNKVASDIIEEIKTHPGYIKWNSGSTIAVVNQETFKVYSIRTILTAEDYLEMVERGDIIYEREVDRRIK